ncbi:MAG TPA: efflux RND transporter permease subunit, partial [Planctomycetaceae bacterium]|nr:efflux RND transporter permease subunit [Planctomycetaceae bacterium]
MIAFFARHPTAANLLMLVLLSAGILSIGRLRRETFPDFSPTEVEIRIVYPGATAEEVEEAVCRRVEDALDQVRYVRELRAEARDGVGIITVEMDADGTYQEFKDEIDTAVGAIDDLPEEAERPIVTHLHTVDPVLALLVTGPMSPPDLKAYCEDLKERLLREPDVALVAIEGFSDHELRIELREAALRRYRLNADQIADIVRRQNLDLPAGAIETRQGEIAIRFVEQRRRPEALEELIILGGEGGAEVRLGDVAEVVDVFERDEEKVVVDGRRAGLLNVYMTKNQDVLRVANAVKTFVERERARYPNVDLRITRDHSTLVRDRLVLLTENAWQGGLLVMLAMWMFFGFRLSFWVVMSLPTSFLGAMFLMPYLGLTVNMMTMVGLLLALGLLMDDGIVIAENIATHVGRGDPPMKAAVAGVREVQGGVLASFVTTVCVLGPLAFLEGDIGKVLEVVPMTLILVLAVSLIEAFLILPAHLAHSLGRTRSAGATVGRHRFDGAIEFVREHV